jgi:hypothetical protein
MVRSLDKLPGTVHTLVALHALLSILFGAVLRGEVLPERVLSQSLLILRDGNRGKSETSLSPLACNCQHRSSASIGPIVSWAMRLDHGRSASAP